MKARRMADWFSKGMLVCASFVAWYALSPCLAQAQDTNPPGTSPPTPATEANPAAQQAGPVVRSETKLVRVDVIVTDKKGNYINDLTAKDFKVYDDNKPQQVENFSFGSDPNSPAAGERRYTVLFFDDSSMDTADQPRARAAATKFVDANVAPDRAIAVVEFTGSLRITQNFTVNAEKLKQVVAQVQTPGVNANAPSPNAIGIAPSSVNSTLTGPSLSTAENNFAAYSVLLSIRTLAKNLASVAGRKSVILFTAGFPLTPERDSELTATIDACNKANVAIYPLDVRGLVAVNRPNSAHNVPRTFAAAVGEPQPTSSTGGYVLAAFHAALTPDAEPQHGGGGGGGGGGHGGGGGGGGTGGGGRGGSGGGTGGGTGGKGGTGGTGGGGVPRGGIGQPFANPNFTQPRAIVPGFPESATTNQQVLYVLAEGTGGFPIFNTNDLLTGLQKIAAEQNEYYLLGFAPSDSAEGSCHTLKVKVERSGTNVRARSGYCNVKPTDALAGKPIEKNLEAHAMSTSTASAADGSIQTPYFYNASNEARVNLAMEIPPSSVEFNKEKGKYHAAINVLGIAYRDDGSIAARFSDQQTFDLEKDEWKELTKAPIHYQNQFAIAPGKYKFTVVLSGGGQNFGKYETPLNIDAYDGKAFGLSGIALTKHLEKVSDLGGALDADLLADHTPLVVHQMEVIPAGSNRFKKTEKVALYAQMYDPRVTGPNPPQLRVAYQVVEEKTGKPVFATGTIDASPFVEKGSPVVPFALMIPVDKIDPGRYRIELQAGEAGGSASPVRMIELVME